MISEGIVPPISYCKYYKIRVKKEKTLVVLRDIKRKSKREKRKMREVSVIIPTYNCGRYLACAIESVNRQKVDAEIILVDDASVDHTKEEVERLKRIVTCPINYIRNTKNLGVSLSRNKGLELAKGKYIAWLDADDWWMEEKLIKQLKKLEQTNGIFCYAGRELCNENGKEIGKIISVPERVTWKCLLYTNVIPCSSVLMKTEIAKEFPMEHDEVHEDYLTWLRILRKYDCAYGINEPLLKSRLTRNGKSRNKKKTVQMTYGVYRYLGLNRVSSLKYTISHLGCSLLRYW